MGRQIGVCQAPKVGDSVAGRRWGEDGSELGEREEARSHSFEEVGSGADQSCWEQGRLFDEALQQLVLLQGGRLRGPHHYLHVRSYVVLVFVNGVLDSVKGRRGADEVVGHFLGAGAGRALGLDPVERLLRLKFVLPSKKNM